MSKFSIGILSSIGIISTTFIAPPLPLHAQSRTSRTCVDSLPVSQRVALTLKADKKVTKDRKTIFQPIVGKASVKPGDIIKYTVIAKNNSRCPLKNLILKQPIPRGTNYLKDSAIAVNGAELLFSVDGGKTFFVKPKIGTQAAPVNEYNYLRWKFNGLMTTNSQVKTTYQLQVK
jgi:uncharacterized repeat protein (TIGR01451 family)